MKRIGMLVLLVLFVIAGCSSEKESSVSTSDVIAKFKAAGLEAESVTDLESDDMGLAPMRFNEGKRIVVPSIGDDKGGRVFVFKKKSDLEELQKYYDELGKASAMTFSHTYSKENVLLQMTGEMEQAQFDKYKEVMDKL